MTPSQTNRLETYAKTSRQRIQNVAAGCNDAVSELLKENTASSVSKILTRKSKRRHGIFFSGETWSKKVAEFIPVTPGIRYFDPACGLGDLLLAALQKKADQPELYEGARIEGIDLQPSFVSLTNDRVLAYEMAFSKSGTKKKHINIKAQFRCENALEADWQMMASDCIIMNPPFQQITAPKKCTIGKGKISSAALFLEKALVESPPGVTIVAILPDVIRSGSRYSKLRELLSKKCNLKRFEPEGRFSKEADVDVAILVAEIINSEISSKTHSKKSLITKTISDDFDVRVGTVVPYRDELSSTPNLYIDVSDLPPWSIVTPAREAKYNGKLFKPPFLAIRRTSSPSDLSRAKATLVKGKRPVMVENHLIVLIPKDRKLNTCIAAMQKLKTQATTDWLNYQIRCRHLTVSSVANIPI